jgi:hypothetical protein
MAMNTPPSVVEQPLEQLLYARLLEGGTRIGLALMLLSFAAYMLGWLQPLVPPAQLPDLWSQPVADYLRQAHAPTGWGWLTMLDRGDIGGLVGVAILAGCSLPGLAAVLPLYLRQRHPVHAALCLAEISIMLLAASGWLTSGAR